MDWFSLIGMLLIVLLVVGLIIYAIQDRPPSPAKLRLPGAGPSQSAD